jgi:pyruvate/2-oxoglutarate/acetoin dehydrogenase E1 component
VHWALDQKKNPEISADLLDLRTLQPLDTEAFCIREENRKGDNISGRLMLVVSPAIFRR